MIGHSICDLMVEGLHHRSAPAVDQAQILLRFATMTGHPVTHLHFPEMVRMGSFQTVGKTLDIVVHDGGSKCRQGHRFGLVPACLIDRMYQCVSLLQYQSNVPAGTLHSAL